MMPVTPVTSVVEIFYPGGFAHDYEYTTRALGIVHYGFWGDRYVFRFLSGSPLYLTHLSLKRAFTRPDVPEVAYPEGFQGNSIPIDGELVARICVERLSLSEEADD